MVAPTCSIVIPCYNQIEFLKECLQSVLVQTFSDWEAVVVDDASTTGNVDGVVRSFPDPRIRLIHHPQNKGLGAARNTGILAGSGEFILPLDCDDQLAPEYLECLVPLLENHPEVDCAFPDFEMFGARKGIIKYEIRDVPFLLHDQWLPGPGTLIRRSLYKMVGGYCEDKGLLGNEDWDFWLGAAEAHFKAAHLAEPLYFYRQHKGSLMTKLALYDYQHREIMYNRHRDLFESYQMGSDFIAAGYLQSVKAYFYHGVYWRVPSLLIQTILLPGRINKPFWFLFFEFIPSFLEQIIKRGIHKFASQTRKMSELLAPKLYRLNFMREIHWDWRARDIDHLHGGLKNDYSILSEILERNGAERILDVSCGSGRLFPLYLSLGIREIVGQDIAPTAINMASLRYKDTSIQLVCSPVTDLNYPDSFFDLAICNRVLQHIPEENLHNVLDAICKMCRLVYVNEATAQDFTNQDKKSFIHDYTKLFNEIGYCVKEEGYVKSEASTSQKWVLYGRP